MVFALTSFPGSVGQVAEWLKAPVSKTGIPFTRYREFESLPVRTDRTTERCLRRAERRGVVHGNALAPVDGVARLSGMGGRVV
jgi:hypothetical protein